MARTNHPTGSSLAVRMISRSCRRLSLLSAIITLGPLFVIAQNCDVDFPDTVGGSTITFSAACRGGLCANLTIGKNMPMGDGDVFIFDLPIVTITGNLTVNAIGSGRIIIPAGVIVNVSGNVNIDSKNPGCTQRDPCLLEIEVHGIANFSHNFDSKILSVIWSGSGTVSVADKFKNTSDGCMHCAKARCPTFNIDILDCQDNGGSCGSDFCLALQTCAADVMPPVITGCPQNIRVTLNDQACTQTVSWQLPNVTDNCRVVSFNSTHLPGSAFPVGTTTVTYTANDGKNISQCHFDVTVVGSSRSVSPCPSDIFVDAPDSNGAAVDWTEPVLTDGCQEVFLASDVRPGDLFPIGETLVQYRDINNVIHCQFKVVITAPQIHLDVSPLVTPDGNGQNDNWLIKNIEQFRDNRVIVVDRWGGLVFEGSRYDNQNVVWKGHNRSGGLAPTGTYFYTLIVITEFSKLEKRGSIELIR